MTIDTELNTKIDAHSVIMAGFIVAIVATFIILIKTTSNA